MNIYIRPTLCLIELVHKLKINQDLTDDIYRLVDYYVENQEWMDEKWAVVDLDNIMEE